MHATNVGNPLAMEIEHMASRKNSTQVQEIRDLNNRIDWLDEERRKLARKLTELEQALSLRDREIEGREQRIQELEKQLSSKSVQIARLSQLDVHLSQFKDEVVQMIEQYDQRRIRAENEIDRLRRVEHEVTAREIADIRKELPAIGRLANDMELRITEESRLAHLIGEQQNRITRLRNQVETGESAISYLEEKEKQNSRTITEVNNAVLESNKRLERIRDRLESIAASVIRLETNQQTIVDEQAKIRESVKSWIEQVQVGEYERNQRMEQWQRQVAEKEDQMKRYNSEFAKFSDQYKEAKMAVQTLSDWQRQLELQQREASELLRVESHRLQSMWDDHQHEYESRWKNFTIESGQRWATLDRHDKQVQEQLAALDEALDRLEQEKDMLQRIQTAQADAIKRIPLLWVEEVEKAIAQNPHRRRQPALVPVREE